MVARLIGRLVEFVICGAILPDHHLPCALYWYMLQCQALILIFG
jgi:hypothetical protein